MDTLLKKYDKIYSDLEALNQRLISLYQQVEINKAKLSDDIANAKQKLADDLAENKRHIAKVNAFIEIARTHSSTHTNASSAKPFDSGILSRLSVQINSGLSNDPYAVQLYTEATAQLIYLRSAVDSLTRANDMHIANLSNEFNRMTSDIENQISITKAEIENYLFSISFSSFIDLVLNDQNVFGGKTEKASMSMEQTGTISIGSVELPLPIPKGMETKFVDKTKGLCNAVKSTILIPTNLIIDDGLVILAEYTNSSEADVLKGIQNILLNNLRHYGQDLTRNKKGIRKLENIPYGLDSNGNILSLDFENSNFATYICGASRSGKSTLIHTIITGILQSTHPDNVEIWLVDFGKTEFSRYVNKNIPHIRYIILDESPELVYDLVDRLTEIMLSRQNKFMGKWEKLSDVPEEKYMPELFVVIDEFSIMSNILANSVTLAKEDYRIKLQTILAKSAKLGMRFIFSSQGFTEGTRGLTEMAKDQIQQRIAMKADYADIKSTLDLKTISERDELLMEQLPVHYALKRIPLTDQGDRLSNAHVLYIPNADNQIPLIESINRTFIPQKTYDASVFESYIHKRPMIKDGNAFEIFEEQTDDISERLNKSNANGYEKNITMFIGSPQRMLKLYPIEMVDGFCENCLLVAPAREKTSGSSLIMSAVRSLKMQDVRAECWTSIKNPIYRQITTECNFSFDQSCSRIEDICTRISQLKKAIEDKVEANTTIFIMNYETLMMDMQYLAEEKQSDSKKDLSVYEEYGSISRDKGEADVNTFLAALELDVDGGQSTDNVTTVKSSVTVQISSNTANTLTNSKVYDARNDLKYILTHGPRWGYHFVMQFDTCGDFRQTKLDESLFRHRIMFQTAKNEAVGIVTSSFAESVSNLTNHIFRYTNGIEEVSFRPYLHSGLCIDGWSVQGQDAVNIIDEEEDYLE